MDRQPLPHAADWLAELATYNAGVARAVAANRWDTQHMARRERDRELRERKTQRRHKKGTTR